MGTCVSIQFCQSQGHRRDHCHHHHHHLRVQMDLGVDHSMVCPMGHLMGPWMGLPMDSWICLGCRCWPWQAVWHPLLHRLLLFPHSCLAAASLLVAAFSAAAFSAAASLAAAAFLVWICFLVWRVWIMIAAGMGILVTGILVTVGVRVGHLVPLGTVLNDAVVNSKL